MCRPLREGVGRNTVTYFCALICCSRPLREGVGRNKENWCEEPREEVALYARAWVEMQLTFAGGAVKTVALYARAWVEISPLL